MSRRSQLAKARRRVTSVFTYLQELSRVRTPPVTILDRHEWVLRIAAAPVGPSISFVERAAAWAPSGARVADGPLLRVRRPVEEPCPEPPAPVRSRLRTGWDEPEQAASLRPEVVGDEAAHEGSGPGADVSATFLDWVARRDAWAQSQAPQALFHRLYELWTRFERESEKYQLYLGDGVLCCVDHEAENQTRHPVLLQKVELRFDPKAPAFELWESEQAPFLYLPMLRHLQVEGKALLQLQERFAEQICDPLGGDETSEFLTSLVQGLWPDGTFAADEQARKNASVPYMYRDPVLYLGHRSEDFVGAIDRYLERLDGEKNLPTALMRTVGVDPERDAREDEPTEPLLTAPANEEQVRALRRLAETGAVLVQGPPGTGKSHTIANLIGHLLAQDKTILVTSQASKALRVVRDKVAGPLQSLCVSLLDSDEDSNRELEESITGILNYLSQTTVETLVEEIAAVAVERQQLAARHGELTARLEAAVVTEYGGLDLDGERVATSEVVRELIEARGQHDWLPGPVHGDEPALSEEDVAELYRLRAEAGPRQADAEVLVPDLSLLPAPEEFADHCDARSEGGGDDGDTGALWTDGKQTGQQLGELEQQVAAVAAALPEDKSWLVACLDAGNGNRDAREPWLQLIDLVAECNARIPGRMTLVLEHGPLAPTSPPTDDALALIAEILELLHAGKKLRRILKGERGAFAGACRVNGKPPETVEHFQAVQDLLEIRALREQLARRWDRQLVPFGAPDSGALGGEIEKTAKPYAAAMAAALRWFEDQYRPCERALMSAGLDWPTAMASVPRPAGDRGTLLQMRALFGEVLPPLLIARRRQLELEPLNAARKGWLTHLDELAGDDTSKRTELVRDLARALRHDARETYARLWNRASRAAEQAPLVARLAELLEVLEAAAPSWAAALREPPAEQKDAAVPGAGDVWAAWSYRRWRQRVEAATDVDVDALQTDLNRTARDLQDVTARYVEKLAWRAQLERTGLEEQQALAGWLALHKKIGKGTGKNAPRLKEEAKRTLVKCREAVPVWIMPLSRVVESFDLATTRFDVVILDEASQCDILGLVCFAMADEVAVVGDHEQVSPYAVGLKTEKIQGLIDELLGDVPNRQLYDGKTSVYDLARQSFGGTIRLLEHFRCVPEIIEYSNQLCYAGDIKPLREASSAKVGPPLVAHRVPDGYRDGKVNEPEAHHIGALVSAMCEMPEYEGCSFGVVSMVGAEQALLIDSVLRKHLPVAQYQRRRLLCGNASHFQGDERDVMLLSMVDAAPAGKRLPIRRGDDTKKIFNVAASRARDQLWVVHSLDPDTQLKDGDFRLSLLRHVAANVSPETRLLTHRPRDPSEFETELAAALRERGFAVVVHCAIGSHVIDLVVEGESGVRIGIQCDGGREMTEDDIRDGLARQQTLERIGWKFLRVRASAFALDADGVIAGLAERLGKLGVEASATTLAAQRSTPPDDLRDRVTERARQILAGTRGGLRAVTGGDG